MSTLALLVLAALPTQAEFETVAMRYLQTTTPDAFQRFLIDASQGDLKAQLFADALMRGEQERRCSISYYHPQEAGGAWRKWTGCRTHPHDIIPGPGGRVRPGVVCVHASRWAEFGGTILWIKGYGVCQVLDADIYRSRQDAPWFDVAAPGPPHSYDRWLADRGRAKLARDFGKRNGSYVILRHG